MNQLTGTGKRKQNHVGPTGSELPTGPEDVRSLQMKRSFFSQNSMKVKIIISRYYELQESV